MDIQSIRPAVVPSVAPLGRPEADPTRQTVRTELSQNQSISAGPKTEGAPNRGFAQSDPATQKVAIQRAQMQRTADAIREQFEHKVAVDAKTGDTVYKMIDPLTKRVVSQYPNEMMLKLRSYRQENEARSEAKPASEKHGVERVA